jgi:putative YphP/YqiW family bacilliredoxin
MANYPEHMVAPMREELVQAGFTQLMTPEDVDLALQRAGTTLLVLNSVCGCAAGSLRPGVRESLTGRGLRFDHLVTVFAGMETEAVRRAREHFEGATPSSPNVAIFRDGKLIHHMARNLFENLGAAQIADQLEQVSREKLG